MRMSFLCVAAPKMKRIAPLMQAMRVLERLFGGDFDDRVHFCQNIIGQMAFDLMAPGQFSDAGHLGFT